VIRYMQTVPGDLPEGVRLVHNFHPGPPNDPGRHRKAGDRGFRYWITDEPGNDRRCYCGWLGDREHYGTGGGGGRIVDPPAPRWMRS
jgi:hypothetical protein